MLKKSENFLHIYGNCNMAWNITWVGHLFSDKKFSDKKALQ